MTSGTFRRLMYGRVSAMGSFGSFFVIHIGKSVQRHPSERLFRHSQGHDAFAAGTAGSLLTAITDKPAPSDTPIRIAFAGPERAAQSRIAV